MNIFDFISFALVLALLYTGINRYEYDTSTKLTFHIPSLIAALWIIILTLVH